MLSNTRQFYLQGESIATQKSCLVLDRVNYVKKYGLSQPNGLKISMVKMLSCENYNSRKQTFTLILNEPCFYITSKTI
jgi:hypothetical protein